MSVTNSDIVFHLLDIQAHDMCIESEQDDVREITYESNSDNDDDEIQTKHVKKKKTNNFGQKEYVIHLFGATESGQHIRCDVTGFRPTLYIRLPENKTNHVDIIKQYITSQKIPLNNINIKCIMKKIFYGFTANSFYPFLQIDVPSIALFRNIRNIFLDENLNPITKKSLSIKPIEIFEANIDPMLRFIHTQNIQPCGWVAIKDGNSYIVENSDSEIIIECDYKQIQPTKSSCVTAPFLTASWDIECFSMTGDFPLAKRTWKKTAKDIITYSNNSSNLVNVLDLIINSLSTGQNPVDTLPKGMTPIYCKLKKSLDDIKKLNEPTNQEMIVAILNSKYGDIDRVDALEKILDKILKPFVYLVGDPVIQIGTILTRGTPESIERHLFVFPDCDEIPDIIVHSYKTEKIMILAWFKWMITINPDILIGYNVFGFDESYIWHRAEELGLINANSPIHEFTRMYILSSTVKLEEKFLSSSAMGDNRMYIWTVHGRLQIDMYHYIKRNNVLPSYKLDEVTKHFMSGKIKSQQYNDKLLILEVAGSVKDLKVGRAIALLDDTGESVSKKLIIEEVNGCKITFKCELDDDALNEMDDATKWVIVKDDVSPQDIFRLHRESSAGRATVGKYCVQDCGLVLDLYKKLETFNNSMSMANVCSVPISYIFTRGQGIKIESLIFKACKERDILIPVLPTPNGVVDDSYEGAIVLNPEPGFYSNSPIGVCDFASLYPSTIVSENISHDSLLWIKDFKDDGTLISHNWGSDLYDNCDGYAYTDIEFDIWRPDPNDKRKQPIKIKCGRRICRYAQPLDGSKSTLPQITTWLLSAREAKKKEMKGEKDVAKYALLDSEQLAYKLTGNSLYGQLGSGTFKIRLQALAASVTAYGRKQILFAKEAIEQFYGPRANDPRVSAKCMAKVVYGDSVTGDTPLLIRTPNEFRIISIADLFGNKDICIHRETKEIVSLINTEIWTEIGWTDIKSVIRHKLMKHKKLFRITTQSGEVDVTEDHSLILANGCEITPKNVKLGMELLHSIPYVRNCIRINLITHNKKSKKYVKFLTSTHVLSGNSIISIKELPYPNGLYVYDLETRNHHFGVGPGALIVHNTDSLFVEFNVRNSETGELLVGREARQATIDITDEAGTFITNVLKPPHDFEFDKAFDPLLMFSKKRYAGNMYENNADDYVHKYMGIALKRRDNAPIVKTIFGGAMKMLLDKRDVEGAFKFVKDKCLELVDGKVSLGQLTVTKSLRADYANPLSIAHKVLADRITHRDPGNAPAAGDRIGYVFISPKYGKEASKLQGERIETPLYVKEHNLKPDYRHYIEHQLQNPISQAFGLLLERIPGFTTAMNTNSPQKPITIDGSDEAEKMLGTWLGFREKIAAQLLFGDCLKKFESSSRHNALYRMFGANTNITPIHSTISDIETHPTKSVMKSVIKTFTTRPISSYLYDSHVVNDIKKSKRATATAAKKKIKDIVDEEIEDNN